jgi:exosome complex component MTR3
MALGSSLVEFGHTKVLCEVHIAPIFFAGADSGGSSFPSVDTGNLFCTVKYAPHIGVHPVLQRARAVSALDNTTISAGKLGQEISLQESGLSHQLTSALLPVLPLEKFPKCTIVVKVTVLQDDGSCLSAAITAATLALVDAQVEILDLVTSCTVAVVIASSDDRVDDDDNKNNDSALYLADPNEAESMKAQATICLAMTPNHKEVTLWSQSGRLSATMASQAMELCRDGCRTYHKFLREVWISKEMLE